MGETGPAAPAAGPAAPTAAPAAGPAAPTAGPAAGPAAPTGSRPRGGGRPEVARGRRPSTTRAHIARQALELFDRLGYDATTVDQIASAAGIGRRSFFRYYESKRDVVWGEFDAELLRLRAQLMGAPRSEPMMDVLRRAVVATNRFGAGELDELRIRIALITTVPALVAHSAVRYAEWCDVVADFVAERMGVGREALGPQTVARASLGAAMAAFARWARHDSADLTREVESAFRLLATGFDEGRLHEWSGGGPAPDDSGPDSTPPPTRRDADGTSRNIRAVTRGGPHL